MAIYRKGQNQFELHESARLGQNKLKMNRNMSAKEFVNSLENPIDALTASNFITEDIARQISYEAGLEDTTVEQHKTLNNYMNAIVESAGIQADVSTPISGDDLARGAAGKKALDALKDLG